MRTNGRQTKLGSHEAVVNESHLRKLGCSKGNLEAYEPMCGWNCSTVRGRPGKLTETVAGECWCLDERCRRLASI